MTQHQLFDLNSTLNSTPTTTKGIEIAGWTISSTRGTIASSSKIDSITDHLNIPLPEMPFPNNHLTIKHSKSGFSYTLDGNRALASVEGVREKNRLRGLDLRDGDHLDTETANKKGKTLGEKPKSKGIKVAYANQWGKSRDAFGAATNPSSSSSTSSQNQLPTTNPDPSTFPPSTSSHFGPEVALAAAQSGITSSRHYDWTYSNTWPGLEGVESSLDVDLDSTNGNEKEIEGEGERFQKGDFRKDRIPTERLIPGPNAEPILFYDDLVLFEDELADNGSSVLRVKVRVMPSCLLILQRFFLRVDEVLFRIFDTRIWIDFLPEGKHPQASIPTQSNPTSTSSTPLPRGLNSSGSTPAPWNRTATAPTSTFTSSTNRNQGSGALNHGIGGLSLGQTRKEMKSSTSSTISNTVIESNSRSDLGLNPQSQKDLDIESEQLNSSGNGNGNEVEELKIIRECSGFQASYSEVKSFLPPWKSQDLSPLTEENWVFQTLKKISSSKMEKKIQNSISSQTTTRSDRNPNPISNLTSIGNNKASDSSYNRVLDEILPARLPLENGGEFLTSNRILGQVEEIGKEKEKLRGNEGVNDDDDDDDEDLDWEGCGERVDVLILKT